MSSKALENQSLTTNRQDMANYCQRHKHGRPCPRCNPAWIVTVRDCFLAALPGYITTAHLHKPPLSNMEIITRARELAEKCAEGMLSE